MKYGVFLFNTTTAAMQAQKVLSVKGYSSTLIPAPGQFHSPSGMAVRFNWMEQAELQEILNKANVQIQSTQEMG
ncbi:MAG: DUF3343 domain-containing protein [Dehalococcoidales bacterium]